MISHQSIISLLKQIAEENKWYWLFLFVMLSVGFAFFWYQITYNPGIYFLSDSGDARWIKEKTSFEINIKPIQKNTKLFKKSFTLNEPKQEFIIYVRAFKFARIFIDDSLVYESDTVPARWKTLHKVKINNLASGSHEIVIMVMNYDGAPVVMAYSKDEQLKTDDTWMVYDGQKNQWSAVELATEPKLAKLSSQFPPAYKELLKWAPLGFLIMLVFILLPRSTLFQNFIYQTSYLRWLLTGCWVVMLFNSLVNTKIMGFDSIHHVKYVEFILNEGGLPLATDGWQMFQSPLFYIVCALLLKFLSIFLSTVPTLFVFKLIPLICGLAQIEICYRCSLLAFPDRKDLQSLALIVGALLPMNLYMSQYFSNEPLLGVLTAGCFLMLLRWMKNPSLTVMGKENIVLAVLLGLALLTKVTALIMIVISVASMILIQYYSSQSVKKIILSTSKVLLVIAIVAGWYYLRNWVMLGKPFIGGWDPSRGVEMAWWQDPGFRGVSDFTSFGYALIYPIYAATAGFWDAIYSTLWADGLIGSQSSFETKPPWNYQFVFVTVCLSIIPTISLISAIVFPVRLKFFGRETTAIIMLCGLSVLLYTFAILYMYLKLPIYSTAKASYSLGLLPCYALLIAFGLANLLENEKLKKLILGFFAWWGFSSYLGYFSIGNATL